MLSLFFSCTNKSEDRHSTQVDSTASTEIAALKLNGQTSEFETLMWSTDFDTTKRDFVLRQHRTVNADTLTPEKVIGEVNAIWENITLTLTKISNDTIYVSIPNSFYLTQSIGTTGAINYLSSTTFNLTELPKIKFVNFDFEEGDHLTPGTYSRDDFAKYR